MGQFLNQPDFIEFGNVVVPSNTINASTNLNKASLWVGGTGTVKAILSSTLGGVVTDLTITSPGVGYATATGVATLNDDGTVASGLTVDITVDGAGGTSMAVITVAGVNNTPLASQAVSFQGVQAGTYLPVIVDYVLIESTSPASLMVACH